MYDTILLAYDGSRETRVALREGAELARYCEARVHLLSIIPMPIGVAAGEAFNAGIVIENEIACYRAILDEGLAKIRAKGLQADGQIVSGDPIEQIVRHARELDADLVVLGHVARHGLARWWHSSVGASLLDELDCSVLVAMRHPDEGTAGVGEEGPEKPQRRR
jgi:nucleotide-binding universal stress UspA family protein